MPAAVAPGPKTETSRTDRPEPADAPPAEADADAAKAEPAGAPDATPDAADLSPRPRRDTLTAFEVRAVVAEMQCLVGGFVDKAYQPTRHEVLLRFRAPEVGRRDLFYTRGKFLCFTEQRPENPTKPPGFAMALRKHLGGGRVFKVEQVGYDRVVVVWVQRRDGDHRIVFELFGDGNCVIVRPDGRILVPLVPESWAHRQIRSGAPYQPPPARADPWTYDRDAFVTAAAKGNRDLVRALALEVGLGGPPAEEVVARAGLDKGTPVEDVDEAALGRCYEAWDAMRREVETGSAEAAILLDEGRPVDAAAVSSRVLAAEVDKSQGRKALRPAATFSAALDALFLAGRQAQERAAHVAAVETQLTKLERQKQAQEAAVVKFENEVKVKALHGEVLFAHYQTVEAIRQHLLDARKQHDWKTIQEKVKAGREAGNPEAARIVRIDSDKGVVVLRLEDTEGTPHEIPIDIRLGVTENANAAYERSKTARNKLAGAREALEGTLARMTRTEEDKESADAAVEEAMQRTTHTIGTQRHHWFEAFRWCYGPDGALIVGGRDAAGNDRLVKKHLADGDRYVHADLHGAPSVVVKSDEHTPVDLEHAGRLAIASSRAFGRAGSGDAYWVTPPQVSKTPQAGEFLSRGAFIVRGERHYMRKLPLEWSIGVVWLDRDGRPTEAPDDPTQATDRHPKLMGGPPDAVHAHSDTWVDLTAGTEPQREATKRLSVAFGAHPDAVARALPVGDVRITGHKGVQLAEDAA